MDPPLEMQFVVVRLPPMENFTLAKTSAAAQTLDSGSVYVERGTDEVVSV